jgi:hypothetical protein
MRSVGLDLQKWADKGLLKFSARRPNLFGLYRAALLIQIKGLCAQTR